MKIDLSIIIVSWNVKEKLRNNLRALFDSAGDLQYEVFVIDNASTDGSAAMVSQEFPRARLIVNNENLGFARACNQGIRLSESDFVLLLNPDMLVRVDTISKSLSWARSHPEATVTGIKLIDNRGAVVPQVRRFPRLVDQLLVIFKFPHFFPRLLGAYMCRRFDYSRAASVDSLRGAFFLINCAAWYKLSGAEKPLLDERYFVWFEEVDFCRQVKQKGGEVWYTPDAECVDFVGASFGQLPRAKAQRYFSDSMLAYFRKWGPLWQVKILDIAWRLTRLFL